MPPHRDWTRRGAGRALLYWPLTAFLLAAAFPALAVPLVLASGLTLLVLGLLGGILGKRWRARKLAVARGLVAEVADTATPGAGPAAWPTGRHARRARTADADPSTDSAPEPGAVRPGAPQPHAA